MSMSCWKAIEFLDLSPSNTMLKEFDGHTFWPHGIHTTFPIVLCGKTISVEVKVVNAPLEYNLLLGHNQLYTMIVVVSLIFIVIYFPHLWKIVTIYQLAYFTAQP
jgi:hypothetical protein